MGKLFSGIFAAILMAGGLTALTIGGAAADHGYPPHINTRCIADNLNNPRVGNPAKVAFRVRHNSNATPRGVVNFEYMRARSGAFVRGYERSYVGQGWDRYSFRNLPRGKYRVRVFFDARPHRSPFQNCRTSFTQTVRPRR